MEEKIPKYNRKWKKKKSELWLLMRKALIQLFPFQFVTFFLFFFERFVPIRFPTRGEKHHLKMYLFLHGLSFGLLILSYHD